MICDFCKAEAELIEGIVPICLQCWETQESKRKTSQYRVLSVLQYDLKRATERSKAATAAFEAITSDIPSGIPHPDGMLRIHGASREATVARMEMLRAHHRLNDFLNVGIVPEDLKEDG